MEPTTQTALINLAIQETPTVVAGLLSLFAQQNPGVPAPTSGEVLAAFQEAFLSSLATDEAYLRTNPLP